MSNIVKQNCLSDWERFLMELKQRTPEQLRSLRCMLQMQLRDYTSRILQQNRAIDAELNSRKPKIHIHRILFTPRGKPEEEIPIYVRTVEDLVPAKVFRSWDKQAQDAYLQGMIRTSRFDAAIPGTKLVWEPSMNQLKLHFNIGKDTLNQLGWDYKKGLYHRPPHKNIGNQFRKIKAEKILAIMDFVESCEKEEWPQAIGKIERRESQRTEPTNLCTLY